VWRVRPRPRRTRSVAVSVVRGFILYFPPIADFASRGSCRLPRRRSGPQTRSREGDQPDALGELEQLRDFAPLSHVVGDHHQYAGQDRQWDMADQARCEQQHAQQRERVNDARDGRSRKHSPFHCFLVDAEIFFCFPVKPILRNHSTKPISQNPGPEGLPPKTCNPKGLAILPCHTGGPASSSRRTAPGTPIPTRSCPLANGCARDRDCR
jgi:hypothetical protein